jgi:diguanylate cyclase (GGDEF)-like protein
MLQPRSVEPTARRPRLRALTALRHDRFLMSLVAGTAATAVFLASDVGGAGVQVVVTWAFIAVVHVCLAVAGRSLSRTPGLSPSARRFWRAVAVAGVIYLAGDLAQVVTAALDPLDPASATGGPVQLAALSFGSAWLGLALLMSPLGFSSRRERVRFWMDVATVMVAAVVVGWYLIVPAEPAALLDAAAPVLMGPVILLLCIFVVAKLTMSGTAPFTRWCGLTGTVASAIKSGADAMSAGGMSPPELHWFLAATVTTHALLTIAVRLNHVQVAVDPGMLIVKRRRSYSVLPYGAIGVTYVLLTVAVVRDDHATTRIALAGAVVSTILVVLRQVAAFRDNERLLGELDTTVTELRLAQEGLRGSLAERDTLAARLRHLAFHDGLTGLPNRSFLLERLDGALASSARTGGQVVVMLIDLDDFKLVNDAWGHAAGDALLREVAGRLTGCVRAHDTVARLGGDEFAVLIEPLPGDDPAQIADRIVTAVRLPVAVENGCARVGASVGIAVHDGSQVRGTMDAEGLLRDADHAMYAVKRDGKGSYAVALTTPAPEL